jgi:shikimate kinase
MMPPGLPVFLVGLMGSGKTHIAKRWSTLWQVPCIDTDEAIAQQTNKSIAEIFSIDGEAYFRELEANFIRGISLHTNPVIATGGGLACFHDNIDWMVAHGIVVWLNPSIDTLLQRLWNGRHHRPLIASANTREDLRNILHEKYNNRKGFYSKSQIHWNETSQEEEIIYQCLNIAQQWKRDQAIG